MQSRERRSYHNPFTLLADLARLLPLSPALVRALAGGVEPARRQRLMLAVSAVNRCPYCLAFHTRLARLTGLGEDEVEALLVGIEQPVPPAELPAVVYARQWAQAGGRAAADLRAELARIYGRKEARQMEALLRLIWIANLLGNTYDRLRARLPFMRRQAVNSRQRAARH